MLKPENLRKGKTEQKSASFCRLHAVYTCCARCQGLDIGFWHRLLRRSWAECWFGPNVVGTRKGDWLCIRKDLRKGEQISVDAERATFALEQAAIRGDGALLSIGGDVAVGFSGFSEWYFLRSCYK